MVDHGQHAIDRRVGQDSMSQIEDMAGPAACLVEDSHCLTFQFVGRSEKDDRVEIPIFDMIFRSPWSTAFL